MVRKSLYLSRYTSVSYTHLDVYKRQLDDFDTLISVAAEHNIDVIIDLVINHTARTHPWFLEGRRRFNTPEYNPNDPNDKGNWYDFYIENGEVKVKIGYFGDHMPELLLNNTAVREEITSISKFWLDRGVKGFRLDAAGHFFETHPENIDFLGWFSDMVKSYKPDSLSLIHILKSTRLVAH